MTNCKVNKYAKKEFHWFGAIKNEKSSSTYREKEQANA